MDENVHGEIARAVQRRSPSVDILRVQDVGLTGADDPPVLRWAAAQGRIVLTSDVSTLVGYAYDRVQAGETMPGVFIVRQGAQLGPLIDDVILLAEASQDAEWDARVLYLPL